MAKRIYITHSDRVTVNEAVEAIHICLMYDINPGTVMSLTNGIAVRYNEKTTHPSFQVWRTSK